MEILARKAFQAFCPVLRSNSEVNFTEVEIRNGNQVIRKLSARLSQPARQPIIFRWDGRSNNGQPVQAGQYIFSYKGYSQQGQQIIPHSDSFLFEHNNQWLSP